MAREQGLRARKKAQQRELIADVAAGLFADRGYDAVSVQDVARRAGVSDQTVYNYFPAKHHLVLDRADEFRQLYGRVITDRPNGTSPANALRPLVAADIDRYRHEDPRLARGQFPAQCLKSDVLRRFSLELREQQAQTVSAAILRTTSNIPAILAQVHAAALICVVQMITDQIGTHIIDGAPPDTVASADMMNAADLALDYLDRIFGNLTTTTSTGPSTRQEWSRHD